MSLNFPLLGLFFNSSSSLSLLDTSECYSIMSLRRGLSQPKVIATFPFTLPKEIALKLFTLRKNLSFYGFYYVPVDALITATIREVYSLRNHDCYCFVKIGYRLIQERKLYYE
jgi:hypothetical protein